jgi:hypothetical protein
MLVKPVVGFDSILFKRRLIEYPDKFFEAFMSAGITVENEDEFRTAYDEAIKEIFSKYGIKRRKRIYKGYHFCFQAKDIATDMMFDLVEKIADKISRIDLYCGYYDLKEISIFGDASGQRIKRLTFLEKYQHAFHHVCVWKYIKDYGLACNFKLDNFEGHRTPAWKDLTENDKLDMEVYYSGSECEPLIAISDIVLKLIQLHQHGIITSRTMLDVIAKRCPSFGNPSRKLTYHSMKEYLKPTTPNSTLRIDTKRYVKHPILFVMWNTQTVQAPKERVKSMFEWSPIYAKIANEAYKENGCFKQFSIENDHMIWDVEKDKLIAWSESEEEMISWMEKMEFETPQVLKKKDLQ